MSNENALLGEWLDLKTVPPSKFKIERTDATMSYTNTGKQIPSIDMFDEDRYIKVELSNINLGAGEQYKTGGANIDTESVNANYNSVISYSTQPNTPTVSYAHNYTESQQFVNSAIQISKKQGKEFEYPVTDTNITISFDISFIKTTASALDVSTADVVKVMMDNIQLDVDQLKRNIISNILGIDIEETILPTVEEPVVTDLESVEEDIKPGFAVGTVVTTLFPDELNIVVDYIDINTNLPVQYTSYYEDIILQTFLTNPEAYMNIIEDIKINCGITHADNISFEFNEDVYYNLLDKVKQRVHEPAVETKPEDSPETPEVKPDVVNTDGIEEAKKATINLPRVGSLMEMWNLKNSQNK